MTNPRTRRERERARQRSREQAAQRQAGAGRRQRVVFGIIALVLIGSMVAGFAGAMAGRGGSGTATTTTTSRSTTTTTTVPTTGVDVPRVPAGAAMSGPTPCPAEDGSSARTTSFSGPPTNCIDPANFYSATISTTKGDLLVNLNPKQAPAAVNNFVVLSRYHFYDGQPFSAILPRKSAAVAAAIDNPAGVESPGYTLPSEVPAQGQIYVFGSIAMVPVSARSDDYSAAFLIATLDQAPDLPSNLTQFGMVVDGSDALLAINKAGSQSGQPTEVITIKSISVTKGVPIDG